MSENKQGDQTVAMIEHLANTINLTQATSAHATFDAIKGQDNMTAVISVYKDTQPSNMVLDKLVDWLEETNQTNVLDKIETLEKDTSWRED